MRKVALFVEGDTELFLIERLLLEIAGYHNLRIELFKQQAGILHKYGVRGDSSEDIKTEVMLANCSTDSKVKSLIIEQGPKLVSKGFNAIIGLLDLYPKRNDEFDRLKQGVNSGLDKIGIYAEIFVSVQEVEAWIINEENHYYNIDKSLCLDLIRERFQIDVTSNSIENKIHHPAKFLGQIYGMAGIQWNKKQDEIHRTIDAIDWSNFYCNVRERSRSLDAFLHAIDKHVFA